MQACACVWADGEKGTCLSALAAAASAGSPAASAAAALKVHVQLCGNPRCGDFSHASEEAMLAAQGDNR